MLLTLARPIPTIPEHLMTRHALQMTSSICRSVNAAMESSVTCDRDRCVVGLRPLVTSDDDSEGRTADVSRRHRVDMSSSGYVRVVGGKLTTYRSMAEDTLNHVERILENEVVFNPKTPLVDRNPQLLDSLRNALGRASSALNSDEAVVYAVRHEAASISSTC